MGELWNLGRAMENGNFQGKSGGLTSVVVLLLMIWNVDFV